MKKATMSMDSQSLDALIRPMPRSLYEVDHSLPYIEQALVAYGEDGGLDLIPDFQRGHVWTKDQQERWMEAVIRGAISSAGLLIQFNSPAWDPGHYLGLLPKTTVCIDGLQRLTAIRKFVAGEIKAFGMTVDQFNGTSYDARRYRIRVAVHGFQKRAELLQYYIDLNAGGTQHSDAEIARVTKMMKESSEPSEGMSL